MMQVRARGLIQISLGYHSVAQPRIAKHLVLSTGPLVNACLVSNISNIWTSVVFLLLRALTRGVC